MGDHRIGEKAWGRRGWPRIDVPAGLESVSPQWGFEQLTPITGRPNPGWRIYPDGDAHNLSGASGTQSTLAGAANRFR